MDISFNQKMHQEIKFLRLPSLMITYLSSIMTPYLKSGRKKPISLIDEKGSLLFKSDE